ncbi:MAG: amino acid permease, partial [Fusobacteriaceae bacterium]
MSNKKISTLALVMIIFIGVFGFGNIANNYKAIGLKSVTVFMLGAVLFFLPMSLIMAEFGAYAKDRTAGIYAWIDIGLGSKIAYIAIWSYFIANIFYLPTLATRVPTYLSFVLQGDSNIENITMAILATMTMIFAVFIGIKFESGFNKISSVVGYLSLFVAGIF